jgi:RNA polymerase sigma factor (sigma-70 family)
MSADPVTRPTLLVRLRNADNAAAWEQFVEAYTPLIYDFCHRAGLQDADAADVAQEVMWSVARAIHKFKYDPQRGRFRTWLLTVTRSKLNNFLAKQQRQPVGIGHSTLANLVDPGNGDLVKNWDRQYYQRLFDWAAEQVRPRIEESTWQAFLLTTIQGQESQEVAARLGISVGAVYIAKCRTLARLKEVLMNVAEHEWESGMHH